MKYTAGEFQRGHPISLLIVLQNTYFCGLFFIKYDVSQEYCTSSSLSVITTSLSISVFVVSVEHGSLEFVVTNQDGHLEVNGVIEYGGQSL